MSNNKKNSKQDVEIATLNQWKVDFEKLVFNHLTTLEKKVDKMMSWLFFGFMGLIATTIITQIILKFFS